MTEAQVPSEARLRQTIIDQDKCLIALNNKLFAAGKFAAGLTFELERLADCHQAIVDRHQAAGAAVSEALRLLEQAHQAAHQGRLVATVQYMAQAMEILAND